MGEFPNKATQFKQGTHRVTNRDIKVKGGKTVTDKQKRAQKLRFIKQRIKKGVIKSDDELWLLERYENKEIFAHELLSIWDEMKKNSSPGKEGNVLDKGSKLYELIHGKTPPPQQINIQTNDSKEVIINIIQPK